MTELEFGARLKQLRQNKHLTQQELADQLGVSNKSVSRWESGGYPDIATLPLLAKALEVSTDELLGCQPPLRTFGRSDWQSLMSYAFALGGGVVFYLLDLFMPSLICYLIYLAMMAYGIYLQRHYTYHSRWFYGFNALMNFFINSSITSFWTGIQIALSADMLLEFATAIAARRVTWDYFIGYVRAVMGYVIPWLLTALVLTGVTHLVIWRTSGNQLPPYRLHVSRSNFAFKKTVPLVALLVLVLFWFPYTSQTPLPAWLYEKQETFYVGLWLILTLAVLLFLLLTKQAAMLLPAAVLQLGSLYFLNLAPQVQIFSKLTQRLLLNLAEYNATVYIHFGQFGWQLLLAAAILTAVYLLFCIIKIESSPE